MPGGDGEPSVVNERPPPDVNGRQWVVNGRQWDFQDDVKGLHEKPPKLRMIPPAKMKGQKSRSLAW